MDLRKEIVIFKHEKLAAKKELTLSAFTLERKYISTESHVKEDALTLEREKLEIERKGSRWSPIISSLNVENYILLEMQMK